VQDLSERSLIHTWTRASGLSGFLEWSSEAFAAENVMNYRRKRGQGRVVCPAFSAEFAAVGAEWGEAIGRTGSLNGCEKGVYAARQGHPSRSGTFNPPKLRLDFFPWKTYDNIEQMNLMQPDARGGKMSGRTLTKADIIDYVYDKTDKNRSEVKVMVESLLQIMKDAIKKDSALLISGLGKFESYAKKARKGRNPHTSATITLPPRKVVVFRLSRKFRAELNPEE